MASPAFAPALFSSLLSQLRRGAARGAGLWREIRSWRRIRFTRSGALFTSGAFAIGLAAINTGNNLLYLLLGAMLGFIAISGWLSEQVIRETEVHRRTPKGVTAGNPLRIRYQLRNLRRRFPGYALELGEEGLAGKAFLPHLPAGGRAETCSRNRLVRRGVYPLRAVTLSTSFPFGLFRKSRDIPLPGELVIWPRTDRKVRPPAPLEGQAPRLGALSLGPAGPRGEYRGLREYRPGDDPRDIHWRSTARMGAPMVREYEQSEAETLWICLDTRGASPELEEAAVETAASLAAQAFGQGRRFAFAAPGGAVEPGEGPGQLERVLDALARVAFHPGSPPVAPPASPRQCLLVTLSPRSGTAFGGVVVPAPEGASVRRES